MEPPPPVSGIHEIIAYTKNWAGIYGRRFAISGLWGLKVKLFD
jgi:hypothetical protein